MITKQTAQGMTWAGTEPAAGAADSSTIVHPLVSQRNTSKAEQARMLLADLWRGGAWGSWWTPDGEIYTLKNGATRQVKESIWFPTSRPAPIPRHWIAERNVYFGVHPTAQPRHRYERTQVSSVAALACLFAEFDVKDYGAKDAILAHLDGLAHYPTAVVDSGGGYHCYWILTQPEIVTDANRRELVMLQRAWVEHVGSDGGAKDLARVLRVPGSYNRKSRYAPDFPKVEIIEYRPLRAYALADLRLLVGDHLQQLRSEDERRLTDDARRRGEPAAGAAHDLLRWAVANAAGGSRHSMAMWLAGKLRKEGIAQWAADSVLCEFARQVAALGDRELSDQEMGRVVRYIYQQQAAGA